MQNDTIKPSIFPSDTEDFIKLFLPALLCIPFIFFQDIENVAWKCIILLSVMDISHVFSTGIEAYCDSEVRLRRNTFVLTMIGLSIAAIIAFFFTSITENIFFYSIVFHNMRQGLGVSLIYHKKSSKKEVKASFLKYSYYFLTLAPVVLFHFKAVYFDFGPLEKFYSIAPLEKLIVLSNETLLYVVNVGELAYTSLFVMFFLYIFKSTGLRCALSMLFFCGIYFFSYLITKNLLYSSLLLMASHAVPYLFLMHDRTKRFGKGPFTSTYPAITIMITIVLGFSYYYFFYRNIGEISKMSALTKFFVIAPSYIHYAFDGHIWTSKNERFKSFLRG